MATSALRHSSSHQPPPPYDNNGGGDSSEEEGEIDESADQAVVRSRAPPVHDRRGHRGGRDQHVGGGRGGSGRGGHHHHRHDHRDHHHHRGDGASGHHHQHRPPTQQTKQKPPHHAAAPQPPVLKPLPKIGDKQGAKKIKFTPPTAAKKKPEAAAAAAAAPAPAPAEKREVVSDKRAVVVAPAVPAAEKKKAVSDSKPVPSAPAAEKKTAVASSCSSPANPAKKKINFTPPAAAKKPLAVAAAAKKPSSVPPAKPAAAAAAAAAPKPEQQPRRNKQFKPREEVNSNISTALAASSIAAGPTVAPVAATQSQPLAAAAKPARAPTAQQQQKQPPAPFASLATKGGGSSSSSNDAAIVAAKKKKSEPKKKFSYSSLIDPQPPSSSSSSSAPAPPRPPPPPPRPHQQVSNGHYGRGQQQPNGHYGRKSYGQQPGQQQGSSTTHGPAGPSAQGRNNGGWDQNKRNGDRAPYHGNQQQAQQQQQRPPQQSQQREWSQQQRHQQLQPPPPQQLQQQKFVAPPPPLPPPPPPPAQQRQYSGLDRDRDREEPSSHWNSGGSGQRQQSFGGGGGGGGHPLQLQRGSGWNRSEGGGGGGWERSSHDAPSYDDRQQYDQYHQQKQSSYGGGGSGLGGSGGNGGSSYYGADDGYDHDAYPQQKRTRYDDIGAGNARAWGEHHQYQAQNQDQHWQHRQQDRQRDNKSSGYETPATSQQCHQQQRYDQYPASDSSMSAIQRQRPRSYHERDAWRHRSSGGARDQCHAAGRSDDTYQHPPCYEEKKQLQHGLYEEQNWKQNRPLKFQPKERANGWSSDSVSQGGGFGPKPLGQHQDRQQRQQQQQQQPPRQEQASARKAGPRPPAPTKQQLQPAAPPKAETAPITNQAPKKEAAATSTVASGPSAIEKMARQLIAKRAKEREKKVKEEAERRAKERERAAVSAAAASSSSAKTSLAHRLHAKPTESKQAPPPADSASNATGSVSSGDEKVGSPKRNNKKRKQPDAVAGVHPLLQELMTGGATNKARPENDSDASREDGEEEQAESSKDIRMAESTGTPNLTENEHTAEEIETAKSSLIDIPAVSESPHSVHARDVPEDMDVDAAHGASNSVQADSKSEKVDNEEEKRSRVLVFSSDSESDSDASSSDSDSDDEDVMAWAAKMFQAKQNAQEQPSTPSAANPMDPDTDVPSPDVGISPPPRSLMHMKMKRKKRKEGKKNDKSSDPAKKKRRSNKPKKPKKTKEQKKLEMLESMYASSDDEAGPGASKANAPTTERALTDAQVRAILGEDDLAGGSGGNYVRRSTRQPSRSVLDNKSVRALISKLENNDRDMVVLKMKKYLPDPDTKPLAIDAVLDALEKNTNCEALYIQNFNEGMRDDQVLHLIRVLQNPACKIWCLNIGETYNVQDRTWEKFAKGLKKTKVTHMYASEHTITHDLKDYIRLTIRNNRSKHNMHIDPDNLDVIIQCTHCWWNPINAKVLRPYLRKKGYEHLLFDKALQGTKDAPAAAVINGGETGAATEADMETVAAVAAAKAMKAVTN